MAGKTQTLRRYQFIFGVIFILSSAVFLTLVLSGRPSPGNPPAMSPSPLKIALEYLSLGTSILSMIALVSTTIISWRRDRRAANKYSLDERIRRIRLEREKLELERVRLRIQQLQEANKDNPG